MEVVQNNSAIHFSVISPVFEAEDSLSDLIIRLKEQLTPITENYEIILVDDGSSDRSWEIIEKYSRSEPRIKGICLSRNFGQHYALSAGLKYSKGEKVAVIDCDLQDDPKYIAELYKKSLEGHDIVLTRRVERAHPFFKNIFAHIFKFIFNWLVREPSQKAFYDPHVGSLSLLSRKAVDAFCKMNDYQRHYLLLVRWLGFKTAFIEVEHYYREKGKSTYSLSKLVSHAIDGVISQSDRLLYLSITTGFLFVLGAFGLGAYLVVAYYVHGFKEGWTSLMVIILFSSGTILMALGVIGMYIGKTFEQTKQKPLYIVDKTLNI